MIRRRPRNITRLVKLIALSDYIPNIELTLLNFSCRRVSRGGNAKFLKLTNPSTTSILSWWFATCFAPSGFPWNGAANFLRVIILWYVLMPSVVLLMKCTTTSCWHWTKSLSQFAWLSTTSRFGWSYANRIEYCVQYRHFVVSRRGSDAIYSLSKRRWWIATVINSFQSSLQVFLRCAVNLLFLISTMLISLAHTCCPITLFSGSLRSSSQSLE